MIFKDFRIERWILHLVIILLRFASFTQTLWVAALLVMCLVSAATLIFLVIEQSDQISSMQSALYEICLSSLAEHVPEQAVDQDTRVDEEAL